MRKLIAALGLLSLGACATVRLPDDVVRPARTDTISKSETRNVIFPAFSNPAEVRKEQWQSAVEGYVKARACGTDEVKHHVEEMAGRPYREWEDYFVSYNSEHEMCPLGRLISAEIKLTKPINTSGWKDRTGAEIFATSSRNPETNFAKGGYQGSAELLRKQVLEKRFEECMRKMAIRPDQVEEFKSLILAGQWDPKPGYEWVRQNYSCSGKSGEFVHYNKSSGESLVMVADMKFKDGFHMGPSSSCTNPWFPNQAVVVSYAINQDSLVQIPAVTRERTKKVFWCTHKPLNGILCTLLAGGAAYLLTRDHDKSEPEGNKGGPGKVVCPPPRPGEPDRCTVKDYVPLSALRTGSGIGYDPVQKRTAITVSFTPHL